MYRFSASKAELIFLLSFFLLFYFIGVMNKIILIYLKSI